MFGGRSIKLARVFGVRIGVDPSWFFVLFLIIWSLSGYYRDLFPGGDAKAFALATASALLFFLSVVLHELGHAVVARRNGIGIQGIDLWLLGGVAKMEREPSTPGEDFRVAAAGPAVTLVIALACLGGGTLLSSAHDTLSTSRFEDVSSASAGLALLGYLASINTLLLAFNLIPGFPLDGGRIARAIAWWRTGDRARATRLAARLGRGFSGLMILAGVLVFVLYDDLFSGLWLGVVGLFLGQAARSAEVQAGFEGRIEGLSVADVMDAEPVAAPETLDLQRALDEYFLRYGWPWFPVVDAYGRLTGLVSRESVEGIPEAVRPGRTVASVMAAEGGSSSFRVEVGAPLESLLMLEGLQRLGAIMAVDGEGRLRGVVTIGRLQRALQPAAAPQ